MRFLLTGGYGCIGSWIIRNLIDRDLIVLRFGSSTGFAATSAAVE